MHVRLLQPLSSLGRYTLLLAQAFSSLGEFRMYRKNLFEQMVKVGVESIPIISLAALFSGAVTTLQTAYQLVSPFIPPSIIGSIVAPSLILELGAVVTAFILAGRVGARISAELGTMRVTEQIDALQVMGADPVSYLVVPRVTACVLMVPILTIFSDLAGVIGGWLVVVEFLGVDGVPYWQFAADFVTNYDVFTGLAKAMVFGFMIGIISCYKGFHCEAGARGVGRAATDAFVTSFLAIIVANLFIAKLFKDLYDIIYGVNNVTAFGG